MPLGAESPWWVEFLPEEIAFMIWRVYDHQTNQTIGLFIIPRILHEGS
jgi:hypothetical protein